jgi:peptide/nickel transport system substrate-binding protein
MEQPNYWQRLAQRRMTRRYLLGAAGTAALGGAAALVVGCGGGNNGNGNGDGNPSETQDPNATPRPGGEITIGRLLNVLGIDPHIDLTGLDIDTLLYTYLYSWAPGREEAIFNNFAVNMEIPDPLHFIFTLRPGVIIEPRGPAANEELTSEDVLASFERRGTSLTAPDKRFPQRIVKKEAPDPYTFKFEMSRPFVPAIREMANPTWAIVPRKVIDEYGLGLSQVAFGSGPFMLEEFRGTERIVLAKNPNFFLKPRPWLDKMTYIIITESSSLLAAFESGQHDINGAALTRPQAEELEESGKYIIAKAPSLFYPCIHMKMRPPFNDIKVREAIDLALNRDEFINIVQDGEGNYNGPIQWAQTKWALPQSELREFYRHDPDRAKALLAEAGYPDGFETRMKVPKVSGAPQIAEGAQLIQSHLSRVGIRVLIDEVELGSFISSVILPGNFEMTFFPNLPYDEPDRPLAFYHSRGVTGTGNWTNYTNPELDRLIDAQAEEFDEEKRKEIILEAQRMILREHGPQLTLTGGFAYAARWKHVHFPYEPFSDIPSEEVGPNGADWWVEET